MEISFTVICCSLLYIIMIAIVYFGKEKIESIENKIYSFLISINIFGLILEILCFFLVLYKDTTVLNSYLNIFFNKFFLFYLMTWTVTFTFYIYLISVNDKKNVDIISVAKRMIKPYLVIEVLSAVIIAILPLYYVNERYVYSYGPGVTYVEILAFISIVVDFIILFRNFDNIRNKKYYPLFTLVILLILVMIIRQVNPGLTIINSILAFNTTLMYFTIENPDVRMIEQLNIAKEQADKANQAKTEFLSSMSHEIRTPLNAIVGFSQNLYEEDIPDSAKEQVKDIISASDSLLEIVNGILDISKIEANKLEIINDEYSFEKIFNELVSLTKVRLGDKDIIFRVKYDESIPKVLYGDKLRVKQVILNILTNSVKYTKNGFIEFKVNSIIKDDVCRLIISVEDSGVGIKKENLNKLFTKFQRFEERNTTIEGTGLGLAITKRLVDLMEGKIVVQSIYGQGSKFTIALDQRIINNPKNLVEDSSENLDIAKLDLSGKKVLVVDDNKLNLKVASKLLEKYKLTIDTANSGMECIEKIKNYLGYDLVLLDDMMPKMTGVETLVELKKIDGYITPTVILTANAIAGMREKYLSDGFDDYLAKPIEKAELNRVLKKFIIDRK